ncbi:MAG: class I SAM-dependent methyltransferase [Planctomycetes bacterium]|nr:class I SAM-dependent methyltransferase [Planctomycetota bacterium]
MSSSASAEWWNKSLDEVGLQGMDKLVDSNAGWDHFLETGRSDLERALAITEMRIGLDRSVLEIGCGVGRLSYWLAEKFGDVVGVDVASSLIEEARRRNSRSNVSFEVGDGIHLAPCTRKEFDSIFSYEVLYYLNCHQLTSYLRDAYQLLRPGGEFVFHLNMEPIRLSTRLSFILRRILYRCGIKSFRGWPTGAGLKRYYHQEHWLKSTMERIGFRFERRVGPSLRQTWIVATKP